MVGFDPREERQLSSVDHGMAGAVSGFLTRMYLQPLDVLKIRFQLQVEPIKPGEVSKYHGIVQATRRILQEEGGAALWKGHVPAQMLSITFGITQFVSFEMLTRQVGEVAPDLVTSKVRPVTHALCGSMSGCVSSIACQPFDVIRTRFVAQGNDKAYTSMMQAASSIIHHEGPRGFYRGLIPTLLQIVPQNALQFGFYAVCTAIWKAAIGKKSSTETGGVESLICGSTAGLGAKLLVYPLDTAKKRLQIQGFEHGRLGFGKTQGYRGFLDCITKICYQEGLRGLYKGLSPSLFKAVTSSGLHFFFYEQTCYVLRIIHLNR